MASEPVFLEHKNVNIFHLDLVQDCESSVVSGETAQTSSPCCGSVAARGPEAAGAACGGNDCID